MTAFCPHCGQPAHAGAAFCPTTGTPIGAPAAAPQSVQHGVPVTSAPPAPPVARYHAPAIEEYSVGAVIGLSLVTCGIFGLVRFYQAAQSYRRIAPGSAPNFEWQFWTYIAGSMVAGVLGAVTLVGYVLYVPVFVIGALMLAEVCAAREGIVATIAAPVQLRSAGTHVTLWVLGQVFCIFIVGIILVVIQSVFFFQDHNDVAREYAARNA